MTMKQKKVMIYFILSNLTMLVKLHYISYGKNEIYKIGHYNQLRLILFHNFVYTCAQSTDSSINKVKYHFPSRLISISKTNQ